MADLLTEQQVLNAVYDPTTGVLKVNVAGMTFEGDVNVDNVTIDNPTDNPVNVALPDGAQATLDTNSEAIKNAAEAVQAEAELAHTGPTDATAMGTGNNGVVDLANVRKALITFAPMASDPQGLLGYKLWVRVEPEASVTPTTIATAERVLEALDELPLQLDVTEASKLYWYQTTAAGVAQAAQAGDYILVYKEA